MRGYEDQINRLRDEVPKAIQVLNEAHTGADLPQARKLLEEAGGAIERDELDQALSLAQEAQLTAKPTTEYLLDRAKALESSGSNACGNAEFTRAIELWQRSLGEYARARALALERKEAEIVSGIELIFSSVERDIETAKKNRANAEMHALIEDANKAADEAKEKFEASQFDAAKQRFESARELYSKSAEIAQDFDFEDEPRIKEAGAEMESSIESCLLAKGEALIEAASKEEADRKEEAFSGAIGYLESFTSSSAKYEELKKRVLKGLVLGRIEAGTQLMEEAEAISSRGEHYQAKEGYQKAQEHFENLRDFAVEQRLEGEKSEVDRFIEDCTANIRACTNAMMDRNGIAQPRLRKVGDLRRGIRVRREAERPGDDELSKLEKDYRSVRYLDSGGFGNVYWGQTMEGQTIALKVLREAERHEKTFFQEFRIWENLIHRNIVRLFRPRYHPMPLFEMEYVDGGDLSSLLKKSAPFSPERACRIAFDIGRGLEYAHLSNVVHGDLKPRNILLTMTEEVKISDWGLGKVATSSSRGVGYTPGYASPEQIQKGAIDKKSDVYQIGVVFYEMLTGDNPFDHGSREEKDEKVLTLVPQEPSKHNPRIKPLDDLIMSCLEKEPRKRPGIQEFREVLSRYAMENYSILLKVTGQHRDSLGLHCRLAMLTAKEANYQECLRALKDLKSLLSDNELKGIVQNLIYVTELRQKEELEITDEVINEIDGVLRQVEYGQS